ncbi:MAG: hypothetical protein FD138_2756 [Planctomycetota bacterium]|nr:MAG: hypothetical protein FD138_2756 [Planctomycetota bacterium]
MNSTAITDSTDHDARIISHLRDEEQTLAILLVAVREIRQALLNRDGERLTQALEAEADSFQMGEVMRDKRATLRQDMAARLHIAPEAVTLSRLERCVSAEASGELEKCRQRLQQMSDELLRLNRQNAAMIQQTLDLTERIVSQLTGGGPHFTSYSATGQSESPHVGPVLQWGG